LVLMMIYCDPAAKMNSRGGQRADKLYEPPDKKPQRKIAPDPLG